MKTLHWGPWTWNESTGFLSIEIDESTRLELPLTLATSQLVASLLGNMPGPSIVWLARALIDLQPSRPAPSPQVGSEAHCDQEPRSPNLPA